MDTKTALEIAKEIDVSDIRSDARAILEAYANARDDHDFTVDFGRTEYRIIHEESINEIFCDEMRELADGCYDIKGIKEKMGNIGNYFTFDYESFIRDCEADGYGYHFNSYDGSELEVGNYHVFRTN